MDSSKFIKNAMNASDLLGAYEELILDGTYEETEESPAAEDVKKLVEDIEKYEPKDACEAGAKAMLLFILR